MLTHAHPVKAIPLYYAVQIVTDIPFEHNPSPFAERTGGILQNLAENSQSADDAENAAKRCMMVCIRWGEDCVVDPDNGERSCRRVCQEFGEQCF